VQTESAKLQVKSGKLVEGRRQLLEMTTYDLKGERLDNVSYPVVGSHVGKEEYKYDDKGNIIEMTLRGDDGLIISRENYTYELDKIGNWVKVITSLLVFEEGELKTEPVEVTYRTITYYFDDAIAKIIDMPTPPEDSESNPGQAPQDLKIGSESESTNGSPSILVEALVEQPVSSPKPLLNEPVPVAGRKEREESLPEQPKIKKEESARDIAGSVSLSTTTTVTEEVSQKPSETKASLNLYETGRNYLHEGDFKKAVEVFKGYIKLEPGSARAYLDLGYTYSKLEKNRDAIKAFKEAIAKNPNLEEAHYLLAVEYYKLGNFQDAVVSFKKAIQLRTNMAQAHYGLALAYQELGKTDLLLQEYRTLQRLDAGLARKLEATFPDQTLVPCRAGLFCK
jgi:Tfp pilus assembly protein PilF